MLCVVVAAALALCVAPTDTLAQASPGVVQGRVLNAQSREPLAGAQVIIVGTQRGTITNRDGTFRIIGVPAVLMPGALRN